ncbi:MAG: hypothetical protein U0Q07_15585 [Acidimicrobiales bacterium]
MPRRLTQALAAIALAAGTVVVPAAAGHAATTAQVNIVHGLLQINQADTYPIDVYTGPNNATSWSLASANLQYSQSASLGDLNPGSINVLLCTHVANPVSTITACQDNQAIAVNGNSGTNVNIVSGANETLVAAYTGTPAEGRPSVLAFVNDVSCVATSSTARVGVAHAAFAPAVNVAINGTATFSNVTEGNQGETDTTSGNKAIAVTLASNSNPVTSTSVNAAGAYYTKTYVVGSQLLDSNTPFGTITISRQLEVCQQPTTTTTSTTILPTTTTTTAPVAVTPAFTG